MKIHSMQQEKEVTEKSLREREMTWQTIRRDITSKRDDAIRDSCKLRSKKNIQLIWEHLRMSEQPFQLSKAHKNWPVVYQTSGHGGISILR